MFGLLTRKISSSTAVDKFIVHVASLSDRNFAVWVQDVLQAAAAARSDTDKIVQLLNSKDTKIIYFSAVCALEAGAIENLFSREVANRLYDDLRTQLSRSFKRRVKVQDLVFYLIGRVRVDLSEEDMSPLQSMALAMMKELDFDEHEETANLLESPFFIMAMSGHFVERGCVG